MTDTNTLRDAQAFFAAHSVWLTTNWSMSPEGREYKKQFDAHVAALAAEPAEAACQHPSWTVYRGGSMAGKGKCDLCGAFGHILQHLVVEGYSSKPTAIGKPIALRAEGVVCHASGERCHGCAHYRGEAPVCEFAESSAAEAPEEMDAAPQAPEAPSALAQPAAAPSDEEASWIDDAYEALCRSCRGAGEVPPSLPTFVRAVLPMLAPLMGGEAPLLAPVDALPLPFPRAEFEAAMAKEGYHINPQTYRDGTYRDTAYAAGWEMWQAAIAADRARSGLEAEVVRDARRYRWLRSGKARTTGAPKRGRIEVYQWDDPSEGSALKADALDRAIDAAIAASRKEGKA